MKQFLITVAGVLAGLVLFLVVAPIVLISMLTASMTEAPAVPSHTVLALDLREPLTDQGSPNALAALSGAPSLLDVLRRIDAARDDDKVKGIYIRAAADEMSAAQAEEIRAALQAFRASGKFVIAHIQGDGVRLSMAGYMAVADSDEVWLQESSEFMPMGLSTESTFFAGTLQRYHMLAQFETREEYKSAAANLTQRGFTPAHREEMTGLMNSLYSQMAANIAADRGLTVPQVRSAIEASPFTAQRARELKLVDQLGRPEDAERAALARTGDDNAEIVDFADYRPPERRSGPVIAVVQGEGAIVSGPDEGQPFSGDSVMNSDRIAEALLEAANDDDVKAIVFRVSSPGGSVVASDQILHALRIAQSKGKKVIISMGEVAASGGYYVSAYADEIIASGTTITGSIGVLGGKLIIGPAMEHYLSADSETLSVGSPQVTMFSANEPFTPSGRAAFAGFIDRAYQQFLGLVAEGRGMTREQVREVARGRVWTGQQALERHLVDRLGGFSVAVARAKELAGIGADTRVQLRFYPSPRGPFEELERLFGVSSESAEALARVSAVMSDPRFQEAAQAMEGRDAAVRAEAPAMRVR